MNSDNYTDKDLPSQYPRKATKIEEIFADNDPSCQHTQRTTTDDGDDELQTLVRELYDKCHDQIKASATDDDDDDDYTMLLSTNPPHISPSTLLAQNPVGVVVIDRNASDELNLTFTKHDLPPPCKVSPPKRKLASSAELPKPPSKKPPYPRIGNSLEAKDKSVVRPSSTW